MRDALVSPRVVALLKAIVPPLDKLLLQLSRGWINTAMQPIVMMQSRGAKSGQWRKTVTLCMPVEDGVVVVGSNWGLEKDPAWVFNLRANPQARVLFRGYKGPMMAEELLGENRTAMWQKLLQHNPQYGVYQSGTTRQIPVIYLRRPDLQSN